jgi:methyl-accepting chemotaxis protein
MEELLKYAIESGAFGVSLFLTYVLFTKFVKKEIIKPIENLQEENTEIKKGFIKFTENINSFIFRILKSHQDTAESVNKNIANMNNLFTEATQHTSKAMMQSHEALKKVNALEETADKLLQIATKTHEKTVAMKSEVKKINEDLIMVKGKMGLKDED